MILGTIIDIILAFIPKKLLLVIIVALIAAIYIGFDFNF
ncbi:MAG: hypothetical protein CM15mP42_06420 [Methanobacteriota archaeon]|jgi:putative flippase GtrA|nr:MAG: hypothetical protein CM15mP42_06420 [Euryarchaeota archaeon]